MRDELLAWLRSKNPNLTQDPLDHDDLIESRLIDSLDFLEFIYLLEELSGEDLVWPLIPPVSLRDNISTDEITPAYICYYYDETLGEFPYLGLKAGAEFPVTRGSVKAGDFVCSVSGKRRGKGSSREQSPYAEMCAGVRLVITPTAEIQLRQVLPQVSTGPSCLHSKCIGNERTSVAQLRP